MSEHPWSPAPARHNSVSLLLGVLIIAALATLGLLVPSVRAAMSSAQPPLTAVSMRIDPIANQEPEDCPELTDARLNRATTAVLGILELDAPGVANFRALHWFRGGPADLVRITSTTPADLDAALVAAHLDKGQVLLASRSGDLLLCGESGPYSAGQAAKFYSVFEQTRSPASGSPSGSSSPSGPSTTGSSTASPSSTTG
jgi:hypothetical protein